MNNISNVKINLFFDIGDQTSYLYLANKKNEIPMEKIYENGFSYFNNLNYYVFSDKKYLISENKNLSYKQFFNKIPLNLLFNNPTNFNCLSHKWYQFNLKEEYNFIITNSKITNSKLPKNTIIISSYQYKNIPFIAIDDYTTKYFDAVVINIQQLKDKK